MALTCASSRQAPWWVIRQCRLSRILVRVCYAPASQIDTLFVRGYTRITGGTSIKIIYEHVLGAHQTLFTLQRTPTTNGPDS